MADRSLLLILLLICSALACSSEKPVEPRKPEPIVIIKTKHPVLSAEQRKALSFPADIISQVELAAGSEAEPFFVTVLMPSENMKGEKGFEAGKLLGFSVRTKHTEELFAGHRAPLRARGYLLFKSHKGYGSLPDIVTVIKGNNTYDILKVQGTEAPSFRLDTKAIIAWLKERQKDASFVVTGAGPDWIEAHFTKAPKNMTAFAKQTIAFAPDILEHGTHNAEKLVERMKRTEGFFLTWD